MRGKICICVPTYQRPALLAEALKSIAAQKVPPDCVLCVVVVDNDPAQSAKAVFDDADFPFPAEYVTENRKGIAYGRNASLEHAIAVHSTHVLFVDDDMRLPPDYTHDLFVFMQSKKADVVRGKMRIVGDDGKPKTPRRASFFARQDILPTNGVLIHKRIFSDWEIRFDPRQISQEDSVFFYRAYLRGARIYHAEHLWFDEYRDGRVTITGTKQKLQMAMRMRRNYVSLRRHLGGFWRAFFFALRQGIPILLLQLPANILLLPIAPKKRGYKVLMLGYKLIGLVRGLWMREVPGTAEAFAAQNRE